MSYYVEAVPPEGTPLIASGASVLFHFSLGAWVHGTVPYDGTSCYLIIGLPGGSGTRHGSPYSIVFTAPNGVVSITASADGTGSNTFYIPDPADFTGGGVSTLLLTNTYSGPFSQDSNLFSPQAWTLYDPTAQSGAPTPVPGCTNPAAINYNPSATSDNGSCILPVRGCTLAGSLNYNPAANVNDGSCIPIVLGCTVPGTVNYNALANKDDGSCVFGLAPADPVPLASCCVWGGNLLLASAWAGDLLSTCVWGPDLLLVSAWTSTDYCPVLPVTATATTPAYYGIANDPYSLGNDPLGGAAITPDTSVPLVPTGPLAYYSIGNEPLLILP